MSADARAICYVDTSALVKRYVAEEGSEAFDVFCDRGEFDTVICPLGLVELSSVLRNCSRTGRLTVRQVTQVRERFLSEVASGGWRIVGFDHGVFASADTLIQDLGAPIAALDALHLACALMHEIPHLATGDRQLATAARKAHLQVHYF